MKIHAENGKERAKQIKFLHGYIKEHKLAVMATVTGNALPQASVIGIAVNEDLELILGSYTTSRKYINLKKNPHVALVIGWEKGKTLQYEGVAEELPEDEADAHLESTFAEVPTIAKYVQREFKVVYKIRPKWLRFTDLSKDPWGKFEVKFSDR